jgi:hypothetical protein
MSRLVAHGRALVGAGSLSLYTGTLAKATEELESLLLAV